MFRYAKLINILVLEKCLMFERKAEGSHADRDEEDDERAPLLAAVELKVINPNAADEKRVVNIHHPLFTRRDTLFSVSNYLDSASLMNLLSINKSMKNFLPKAIPPKLFGLHYDINQIYKNLDQLEGCIKAIDAEVGSNRMHRSIACLSSFAPIVGISGGFAKGIYGYFVTKVSSSYSSAADHDLLYTDAANTLLTCIMGISWVCYFQLRMPARIYNKVFDFFDRSNKPLQRILSNKTIQNAEEVQARIRLPDEKQGNVINVGQMVGAEAKEINITVKNLLTRLIELKKVEIDKLSKKQETLNSQSIQPIESSSNDENDDVVQTTLGEVEVTTSTMRI